MARAMLHQHAALRPISHPAVFLLTLFAGRAVPVEAHDTLATVVEQRVSCSPHREAIDISVRWSFHAGLARAEREAMDLDNDGTVSVREGRQYAGQLLRRSETLLHFTVANQATPLVSYYDPEIDLGGTRAVGPSAVTVRLECFARWPAPPRGDVRLVLQDTSWLHHPALIELRVGVRNRHHRQSLPVDILDRARSSVQAGAPRVCRFEVGAPPDSTRTTNAPPTRPVPVPPSAVSWAERSQAVAQATVAAVPPGVNSWRTALWPAALLMGLLFLLSQTSSRQR